MNIKIFVAGAQNLEGQKDYIRIAANEQSVHYNMKSIDLSFFGMDSKRFRIVAV